jgi:hypothetical protein
MLFCVGCIILTSSQCVSVCVCVATPYGGFIARLTNIAKEGGLWMYYKQGVI